MKIRHHPTDQTLMEYSCGTLSQAMEVLIATHLTLCPDCRRKLARFDAMGGSLLDHTPTMTMDAGAFDAVMGKIGNDDGAIKHKNTVTLIARDTENEGAHLRAIAVGESPMQNSMQKIPRPLAQFLPQNLDTIEDIPWKTLSPGVKHFPLRNIESKGTTRLLKIAPGTAMPDHGHHGHEMTLLIKGSYIDEIGRFCAGDIADLNDDIDHKPVADTSEECICLIATDAPTRFNSLLPRLLQPLFGI